MQFQLQFYWWGCPKKTAKLRHLILLSSDILSTGGDALYQCKVEMLSCSNLNDSSLSMRGGDALIF